MSGVTPADWAMDAVTGPKPAEARTSAVKKADVVRIASILSWQKARTRMHLADAQRKIPWSLLLGKLNP
jgi:hypothetical protein